MNFIKTNLMAIVALVLFNSCGQSVINVHNLKIKPDFKDYSITAGRMLTDSTNSLIDSIQYISYELLDNNCSGYAYENVNYYFQNPDELDSIYIPKLIEGTYTLLFHALTYSGAEFHDKIYFTIVSDTSFDINMENYQTRFTVIDTSEEPIESAVEFIRVELYSDEYKTYQLYSCSETEYWSHELFPNISFGDFTLPINENSFQYLDPSKVHSMDITFCDSNSQPLFTEFIELDNSFWMEYGKSYSLEINLAKLWNHGFGQNQYSSFGVNWIENDWTEVSIPIN